MTVVRSELSAHRALGASALALVVAVASLAPLVPPMIWTTLQSIPRTALLGSATVVGLLLHWIFLGIAAQRLGRSVAGWAALAVGLFPIGGVTALILLGFFGDEVAHAPPAPASGG